MVPIKIELIDDAQIETDLNSRTDGKLNWLISINEEKQSGNIAQQPKEDHDLTQSLATLVLVVAEELRDGNCGLDQCREHSCRLDNELSLVTYEEEKIERKKSDE